ncbi:DUF427 domain-containing protein [Egibacter rhizosphaerae]|uniref:DUF427 domain-containing protein n=1 Tax=Egibacter rhizosphaerae TaxID=1670831 RepID=A0A411YE80_9ACTN|nr:DUF427 domain-containing protein [Egibacter rhizosphaerae]QBI19525.1 DUF427 domain-containing protein [Egibacter rhizosphaerae]
MHEDATGDRWTDDGAARVERGAKRVRAQLAGTFVADTTRPLLVWEHPHYPTYYVPEADVRLDLLRAEGESRSTPAGGHAEAHGLAVGERIVPGAAHWYRDGAADALRGYVRLDWGAMDAWFEEDEQVFVHPRDPYKRVDVLQSSRHVQIAVEGITIADSHQPRILFETGLPPRYYLPKPDVAMSCLEPTDTVTRCPYKGTASYYAVKVQGTRRPDLAWWYPAPTWESALIAGYVCFYDERVEVTVDGVRQVPPDTPFA